MDSQNSDLLPKLPQFDKNYKIDPYLSMKKKKKRNEDDEEDQDFYDEENDKM